MCVCVNRGAYRDFLIDLVYNKTMVITKFKPWTIDLSTSEVQCTSLNAFIKKVAQSLIMNEIYDRFCNVLHIFLNIKLFVG